MILSVSVFGQPANNPPVAICQDVTVVAGPDGTADADVDGGSSDPDGDPITLDISPEGPYPLGETAVTLTVTDDNGASDTCTATVTVVDTTPPEVICQDVTVVAGPDGTADADVDGGSNDNSGDPIAIEQAPPGPYLLGKTVVTLTVTDSSGNTDSCTATVTVLPSVAIDIKPESCPNPLKLKGKGVLAVAILGTDDFDVTQIDPTTVKLSREGIEEEVSPLRWAYEDVATPFEGELCDCHILGPDGWLDLTLKFKAQELVVDLELNEVAGDTILLILTGNLMEEFGGTLIGGGDCVWILE